MNEDMMIPEVNTLAHIVIARYPDLTYGPTLTRMFNEAAHAQGGKVCEECTGWGQVTEGKYTGRTYGGEDGKAYRIIDYVVCTCQACEGSGVIVK